MSRDSAEKELVDAIIDGDVDSTKLAEKAGELGKTRGEQLTTVTRTLLRKVQAGKIEIAQARDAYRQFYVALSLATFTQMANNIIETVDEDVARVKKAIANMKGRITKVGAIRKADVLQRELEKQGVVDKVGNENA